jgi:hypothetical protein
MRSSPTIGRLSMKLDHEFKIMWLVWIFQLFIYSVKWSFLDNFWIKICVCTLPNCWWLIICNLFIKYDFYFFWKIYGLWLYEHILFHACEGDFKEAMFYYMELKYEKTMFSNSKGTQIWQPKNAYVNSLLWMPCPMPL